MWLRVLTVLLTLGYPFCVYWGGRLHDGYGLFLLLLVILLLRWFSVGYRSERVVVILSVLALLVVTLQWGASIGLRFYPVVVNLGLLLLFGGSLFASQTVVERLARLKEPDLPARGVAYTRKVTLAWCVFFMVNGLISAGTSIWASEEVWLLYNGLIAYILIGALMVLEWLIRQRIRRQF